MSRILVMTALAMAFVGGRSLLADEVQLINGDKISGSVISLTETQLKFKSEVLGEILLPRDKVAAVYLGDYRPAPAAAATTPANAGAAGNPLAPAETPEDLIGRLTGKAAPAGAAGPTPEELVQQLQSGQINPQALGDVQKAFPLLAAPEAQGYFNEMLGGLMTGKKNIQDLRKDAVQARDVIKDLQKDLGPDAAALNGYLGILNKFIDETAPPEKAPAPNPPAESQPTKTPRFPAPEEP